MQHETCSESEGQHSESRRDRERHSSDRAARAARERDGTRVQHETCCLCTARERDGRERAAHGCAVE